MSEARPEKTEASSPPHALKGQKLVYPGQSPWVNKQSAMLPVRAKALEIHLSINILTV